MRGKEVGKSAGMEKMGNLEGGGVRLGKVEVWIWWMEP